jgi:hypothetical protein
MESERQLKQEERDRLEASLVAVLADQQRHLLHTVSAIPEPDEVLKAQVAMGAVMPPPPSMLAPTQGATTASPATAAAAAVQPQKRLSMPGGWPTAAALGKAKVLHDSDSDD